jgi:DNA-binding transcriptional MocR family regulator
VAHVGAASKTMAPGVRLGWISPGRALSDLAARKSAARRQRRGQVTGVPPDRPGSRLRA